MKSKNYRLSLFIILFISIYYYLFSETWRFAATYDKCKQRYKREIRRQGWGTYVWGLQKKRFVFSRAYFKSNRYPIYGSQLVWVPYSHFTSGTTFVHLCLLSCTVSPFWKGVYTERKEFAPNGSKFFPLRVDLFSEGSWRKRKHTGIRIGQEVVCRVKMVDILQSVASSSNKKVLPDLKFILHRID